MTQQSVSPIPSWRLRLVQWDVSHNAIALSFFAFTALWQSACLHFGIVQIPNFVWYTLWIISCFILCCCLILTVARLVIFPPAFLSDFNHPRLVNFFFLPVLIGAFAVITTPDPLRSRTLFTVAFYILAAYQLSLTLCLYGEWLIRKDPTSFIHPLVFMQTVGFFLLSIIAASAHLVEQSRAMLAVGTLFWLLVFITNFQHLTPALEKRGESPAPTFFLFIAAPAQAAIATLLTSAAATAADSKTDLDSLLTVSKSFEWPPLAQAFLHIDVFIYLLLIRLLPTLYSSEFSASWWAYIFPLSAAGSATVWRFKADPGPFWAILTGAMVVVASVTMAFVSCRMVCSVAKGNTPSNEASAKEYRIFYMESIEELGKKDDIIVVEV